MKKHPLLSNLILTMAIQIGVYLIIIFELQIIEPILQALGVRSEGIMAPTEVVRFFVMRVVLITAAISAGAIRSKVYFWIPSFLLIFVGFAIYYPDILPRVEKTNMVNLPLIAEHLGYGTIIYSVLLYFRSFISFFLIRLPVYYYFGKTANKAKALTDEIKQIQIR